MDAPRVAPKLVVEGADRALDFYASVLDADVVDRFTIGPQVVFAELRVGGSTMLLKDADETDAAPPAAGGGVVLDILTPDPDGLMNRALAHGAECIFPVADQPYGARQGRFRDPFGHQWIVGTELSMASDDVQAALDQLGEDA